MSTNNVVEISDTPDILAKRAAWRRLEEIFSGVPTVTRVPVQELNEFTIFGSLSSAAVLADVAVDKANRLWRHDRAAGELIMFFDPADPLAGARDKILG